MASQAGAWLSMLKRSCRNDRQLRHRWLIQSLAALMGGFGSTGSVIEEGVGRRRQVTRLKTTVRQPITRLATSTSPDEPSKAARFFGEVMGFLGQAMRLFGEVMMTTATIRPDKT